MKKTTIALLAAILMAGANAMAQTTKALGSYNNPLLVLPPSYATDGKPLLEIESDGQIALYNETLDQVASVSIPNNETTTFTVPFNHRTRQVLGAVKDSTTMTEDTRLSKSFTFDDWVRREMNYDPSFTKENNVDTSTGDTIIYAGQYSQFTPYFCQDYFGTRYPMRYMLCKNNVLYVVTAFYHVLYSDWSAGERIDKEITAEPKILALTSVNLNAGTPMSRDDIENGSYGFKLSQTLFNDDSYYEYISLKPSLVEAGTSWQASDPTFSDPTNETIITEEDTPLTEKSDLAYTGISVYSSDGRKLNDIDFGEQFRLDRYHDGVVLTFGDYVYLVLEGITIDQSSSSYSYIFYQIDRSTNGIQKVKQIDSRMLVVPKTAARNSNINITLDGDLATPSTIQVYSSNGMLMKTLQMPANAKSATINTQGTAGIYNIARVQNGHITSVERIIVK